MHTLELEIRKIRGGFIVTVATDEPLTKKWNHEEEYAATLEDAVEKVAAFANSLVQIKRLTLEGGKNG